MYLLICSTNNVLILFWDKIYWDNKSKLLLVGEQLRTTLNLIRGRDIAEIYCQCNHCWEIIMERMNGKMRLVLP